MDLYKFPVRVPVAVWVVVAGVIRQVPGVFMVGADEEITIARVDHQPFTPDQIRNLSYLVAGAVMAAGFTLENLKV